MSSMFTSVQNLDDPFVDQPCTPSPALERIRHHQEQLEQSAKSPRSASKTRFTAEDIEKINATRRSRRKQLVCFLKNRTHLRQLDKVLYDAGIDNLNADDRDYLIQQGPWEIVELPDGEQVLESRRDEFKSAMTELDEETVAIGLKCRESLSAHASLKAIHDRLQGDDKVPKRGNDVFQTCKFNMHSYVDMMRDMFASFCRVVDDAGNNEKPGEHMDAVVQSSIHFHQVILLTCFPTTRTRAQPMPQTPSFTTTAIALTTPSPQLLPPPRLRQPISNNRLSSLARARPHSTPSGWNSTVLTRRKQAAQFRLSHPTTWTPKPTRKRQSRRCHRSSC